MFNKNCTILLFTLLIFYLSCSDDPTSTKGEETIKDIDGNTYQIVKIGDQWWMAENLKVTHYRNGDAIPNVTIDSQWVNLTTGAYCDIWNNSDNAALYGRLYNWHAVNDSRNIAPAGWHVPSDEEGQTLIDYLGGNNIAGGKLKESGTEHWNNPNLGATNESGFTALPVGYRSNSGVFIHIGINAYFWYSTENNIYCAFALNLNYSHSGVLSGARDKQLGYSVRCVKD